jgi:hypothetical protein
MRKEDGMAECSINTVQRSDKVSSYPLTVPYGQRMMEPRS